MMGTCSVQHTSLVLLQQCLLVLLQSDRCIYKYRFRKSWGNIDSRNPLHLWVPRTTDMNAAKGMSPQACWLRTLEFIISPVLHIKIRQQRQWHKVVMAFQFVHYRMPLHPISSNLLIWRWTHMPCSQYCQIHSCRWHSLSSFLDTSVVSDPYHGRPGPAFCQQSLFASG